MNTASVRNLLLVTALVVLAGAFGPPLTVVEAATPPTVPISQVPLTSATPTHPQVLFAMGNSESMDGDLSGAIRVGSGLLSSGLTSLYTSSSLSSYTIPAGFAPPVNAGSGGIAPYTVNVSGTLYDNGPSRMNVAKGGVNAILQSYMANTDFALLDYQTSGSGLYPTWVYYMSPPGSGFKFTNTQVVGNRYVANPCYNYLSASSTVKSNCTSLAGRYGSSTLSGNLYMQVQASSDDPSINDVLYAGGQPGVFVSYNGPNPASPYPPSFSLANYNNGNIFVSYNSTVPNIGGFGTSPTNAGYVPFSQEVMYAQRGFGYGGSQSSNTGNVVVPMTSAGTTPTLATVNAAIAKFTPYLNPETNNLGSGEIKSIAGQAPTAGLLTKANTYLAGVKGAACSQYVILISDGLPTEDLDGNFWPPLGSAAAAGYGVTATFNTDGSLNTTNDQALTDTINALKTLAQAGVKTYVVGLGAGVDPTLNAIAAQTLNAMAVAGGTYNANGAVVGGITVGYLAATSPAALVSSLNAILVSIQAGTLSTTSAAVNSASLITGTTIYQTTYTSSDTPYQDWTGNVLAYGIDPATGALSATPKWQANAQLDKQVCGGGVTIPLGGPTGGPGGCSNTTGNRLIATWNPVSTRGTPFEWGNLASAQQTQLGAQTVLNYLRGDTSLEKRNGGSYRNRSELLGDITDSNPIYVGSPTGPYNDASYASFEAANRSCSQVPVPTPCRPPIIYVGANDGMLHAIDTATGNELFAYVPNAVFGNLSSLSAPLYNQAHKFFVDGSPTAGDALLGDGYWHTLLVGGEGAGGNTMFALDVTAPQNITSESTLASKVLWEFSDSDMGLSYSQPAIARINANPVVDAGSGLTVPGFAVFFGNGYNSPSGHAILYAVHPKTGAIIAKIDLCSKVAGACSTSLPDGLSGVVAANANGLLGAPVDMIYAGDLQGNLWAINVTDPNPVNWTVRVLFKATDASNNPQPITSTPSVTLNPNFPTNPGLMVFFGTGQLLNTNDLSSSQTQTFYGVWDNCNYSGPLSNCTTAYRLSTAHSPGSLQAQTLSMSTMTEYCLTVTSSSSTTCSLSQPSPVPSGQTLSTKSLLVRTVSNNPISWATQQGWYIDLPGPTVGYSSSSPAERVLTTSTIENGGVVFTTNTPPPPPSSGQCSLGYFSSFLMDVNFINGGSFSQPRLDVGAGSYSQTGAQSPVGIALPQGFAPAPTIVGNGGSSFIYVPPNKSPTPEKYAGRQRLGWWQVQ